MFQRKKKVAGSAGQLQLTNMALSPRSVESFSHSDSRQQAISDAVTKKVIKDLAPIRIVECEGFRDLLSLFLLWSHGTEWYHAITFKESFSHSSSQR